MKNHHNVLSQAAEQMQFAEDFDRSLGGAEKLEAAAKFDDVVESTLLQFADSVKTYDHDIVSPGRVESRLLLTIPQEDRSSISASVESVLFDDGTEGREIHVQEVRENGYGRKFHRYYLKDGWVLRHDVDDMYEKGRCSPSMPSELSEQALRQLIDYSENERKNSELERQFGLNDQPVGVDEINKLAELLESESVRPDRYF